MSVRGRSGETLDIARVLEHIDSPRSREEITAAIEALRKEKTLEATRAVIREATFNTDQVIGDFLQDKAAPTQKLYAKHLKTYITWTGGPGATTLLSCASSDARKFLGYIKERYQPNTVRTIIASVRSLYSFLEREGFTQHNPFVGL